VSCHIAPLPPDAAEPLSRLHRLCFPDDPWDGTACREILDMLGCFGFVAWEDAAPIGFALALDLGGTCEILSLGVAPDRRRRGAGAALLATITTEARRRGSRALVLEVAEDNPAAAALYVAHGFVAIGRRAHYYRRGRQFVDALVLQLHLDSPADSI
jgi:ribosomal-protein-alanine N-acetyltransferase